MGSEVVQSTPVVDIGRSFKLRPGDINLFPYKPVTVEPVQQSYDVGIIIGRFQTPTLHPAHMGVINYVKERHARVYVFLGCGPVPATPRNPLDFETRRGMIEGQAELTCIPILDCKTDEEWSTKVDELVNAIRGNMSAVLYGGRDSFIGHYKGKFETRELMADNPVSATEIREAAGKKCGYGPNYRAGVLGGVYRRFFNPIPTVDIMPYRVDASGNAEGLFARKPKENKFRFIGGFVDPTDGSLESAAARELYEEANIFVNIADLEYVDSFKVNDWRYRGEPFGIMTTLFRVKLGVGDIPTASDDICELIFINLNAVNKDNIVEEHVPLLGKVLYL